MKMSLRWLLAASLLIATPAIGQEAPADTTAAQPSATVESQVETLLSGIERVATADDWAKLGDAAVPVLVRIMRDRKATIVKRGRAAIGLGHFDSDPGRQALRMVLVDASSPSLLLRKSMIALARLDGDAAVDAIAVHLDHRAKRVREQAIKTLGELGSDRARQALGARSKDEQSRYLRELIATELQKPASPTLPNPGPEVAKESAQ